MTDPTFKEQVSHWRQRHRFSLKLAADILGVSVGTYKNWEYGQNEPAKICLNCVLEKMKNYKDPE